MSEFTLAGGKNPNRPETVSAFSLYTPIVYEVLSNAAPNSIAVPFSSDHTMCCSAQHWQIRLSRHSFVTRGTQVASRNGVSLVGRVIGRVRIHHPAGRRPLRCTRHGCCGGGCRHTTPTMTRAAFRKWTRGRVPTKRRRPRRLRTCSMVVVVVAGSSSSDSRAPNLASNTNCC
jgi:hypothetical protein